MLILVGVCIMYEQGCVYVNTVEWGGGGYIVGTGVCLC